MDLLPWQRAKKWHMESGSTASFEEVLGMFLREGFVWSSPTEFVLLMETLWEDGEMRVGQAPVNCWFVYLAASGGLSGPPLQRIMDSMPYPLPFVAWQRRGKLRHHVFEWANLKTKTKGK